MTLEATELECWRCGAEGKNFNRPSHPDGGGTICHECWQGIYEPTPEQQIERLERFNAEVVAEVSRLQEQKEELLKACKAMWDRLDAHARCGNPPSHEDKLAMNLGMAALSKATR